MNHYITISIYFGLLFLIVIFFHYLNKCDKTDMIPLECVDKYLIEQKLRMDATYTLIISDDSISKPSLLRADVPIPSILPTSLELKEYKYSSSLAAMMIHFSSLAYDFALTVYPNESECTKLINAGLPSGAILKKLLVYTCSTLFSYFYSYGGYIIEYTIGDVKSTVIVLRGTAYLCEWYEDSKALLSKTNWLPNNVTVHTGINNVYAGYKTSPVGSVRTQIMNYLNANPNINNVIITGHSLGAGVGMLLFSDIKRYKPNLSLNTKFYGFATPAIGNQAFCDLIVPNKSTVLTGVFKIVNVQDPVAATTPLYYVRIPSQLFCFYDQTIGFSNSHFTKAYAKGVETNYNLFNQNKNKKLGGIACTPRLI